MRDEGASEREAGLRAELAAAGRAFGARGWVPATSGNLSARLGPDVAIITASGRDKGALGEGDFLAIDLDGAPLGAPEERASAEAPLHGALYRRFADVRAVLHVHSPAATTISLVAGSGEVTLRGYEMQKALAGVTTHEHAEVIPVLPNEQDTVRLSTLVGERLDHHPDAHAYLLAGHGLYTWGWSVAEARRHVEALEFLFDCELRRLALRGDGR
jgi:methylthioribulose-1-phosphate dehydratase